MKKFRFLMFVILTAPGLQAQPNSLVRRTPEAEGVSSQQILNFLDAANQSKHEFHSIMILRHGKVVAEGWWNPYKPDLKHTMYSVSKSFTATAIGFAVAEKKLSVEDPVIKFFPEKTPSTYVNPKLPELKVKHLLSMSVGQTPDPSGAVAISDDWIRTFLNTPIINEPGSKFLYNSAATYMLSAIIQKVTGQKTVDYLTPRLFKPLGIDGMDWEVDPTEINVGGWGLRLKTEDMAKFGQLFLQKGKWGGKEILPASWIEEASSMKIMQNPQATQAQKDSSDWLQGYCYQMWRSRNNSYRGDGAYGQFIIVLPEKDAVIAIQAETSDMQKEFNLVWKYLLPAFQPGKLAANKKIQNELKAKLASLSLSLPTGISNAEREAKISGKTFTVVNPDRKLKSYKLEFNNGLCRLVLNTDSIEHQLNFSSGKWMRGETVKNGPYLVWLAQSNRSNISPFKTETAYRWKDEKTLEFFIRYIESPHTETIVCTFNDADATIDFRTSIDGGRQSLVRRAIQANPRVNAPKLIVRGDDMGYSHSGNQALVQSYLKGIETSIEVIVPSPWFPETVKLLKQLPRVDVGLHFAITSEWDKVKWRPLTDAPSLRNADGYFYPMLFPNTNYPGQAVMDNPYKVEDIEKELRAQIEMARKYFPRLSHVSGHMGSLAFAPEVKSMVNKISKEYNLPMVDADGAMEYGIAYTGFDFRFKSKEQRIDAFIEMLDKLEDGKTYVYVEHPGLDNNELRAISHIGYEDVAQGRQDVTDMFTSEKVKEAIIRRGIQLVSYREVFK